jgi:energy-coupling factor transporter transmembrane protein EcfT
VHPATRLGAFVLFAVFVPLLPLPALGALCVALLLGLAARGLLGDYRKLMWRTKFVLLALGFAYVLGGSFDAAALQGGLRSVLYLLGLLAALLLLVLSQSRAQLLCGLVTSLRPLAALGLPTHLLCVRMMLTLEYATALRGQPWRELLAQVMRAPAGGNAQTDVETIVVPRQPWRWVDTAVLLACAALLGGFAYLAVK